MLKAHQQCHCQYMALFQPLRGPVSFLSEGKACSEHICEQSWSRHRATTTVARRLHAHAMQDAKLDGQEGLHLFTLKVSSRMNRKLTSQCCCL